MLVLVTLLFVVAAIPSSAAQHQPADTATRPELDPKLGSYQYAITTSNPEAQRFFNQGLTLLYGFNHDEAARYFRRASELDPYGKHFLMGSIVRKPACLLIESAF